MKKINLLLLFIVLVSLNVSSQDFGMKTATKTDQTSIFVGDCEIDIPIFTTTSGSKFIQQVSKKDKIYAVWIGNPYEDGEQYHMYKGFNHQIRVSSKGKLFILTRKTSTSNIYCKYIK